MNIYIEIAPGKEIAIKDPQLVQLSQSDRTSDRTEFNKRVMDLKAQALKEFPTLAQDLPSGQPLEFRPGNTGYGTVARIPSLHPMWG